MKKITLLLAMLIGGLPFINAQNTVEVDANAAFVGYANVFDLPADGGAFVFGDVWGVADLKTVIDTGAGTVTLQPNFSAWDPADPFWVNQTTGEGNKTFEGNTYVEDSSLIGEELTFIGGCVSNTIDAGYEVVAFIKIFNSDFSVLKEETAVLVEGENFSITYTDVAPEDTHAQYGFKVTGPNADPADEAMLGSVVVSATFLGTNDLNVAKVSLYPNPASTSININAEEMLESVRIFNVLGQEVMNVTPSDRNVTLEISSLQRGVYLADVVTSVGSKTIKFIKE